MCRFYDYAPYIFNNIREMEGISPEQYLASIGPERLVTGLLTGDVTSLAELCSPGKSGSFLYFTYDGNFIMKTVNKGEYKVILSTLQEYHKYLQTHPNSLITRYFGLHKIVMVSTTMKRKTFYFVMMKNIFKTKQALKFKFDLKGSSYGRETKVKDDGSDLSEVVLKDNNWRNMNMKIRVTELEKLRLQKTFQEDADFLRSINIIDYSLLVGIIENDDQFNGRVPIENVSKHSQQSVIGKDSSPKKKMYIVQSSDTKYTYHMGIIDTTTNYGLMKKGEALFKRCFQGDGVSCTHPIRYAERFCTFLSAQLE